MATKLTPAKGRTLVSSAARTATDNSGAINFPITDFPGGKFRLECTAASGTSPTLDVAIQTTPDDGTTWITCWRFAQTTDDADRELTTFWALGADGSTDLDAERAALATTGGALSLPTPISDKIRVVWTIGGTTPSFTFSVFFIPFRALGQYN